MHSCPVIIELNFLDSLKIFTSSHLSIHFLIAKEKIFSAAFSLSSQGATFSYSAIILIADFMDTRSWTSWIWLTLIFCLNIVHETCSQSTSLLPSADAECKPSSSRPSPIQEIGENADLYINAIIALHQSNSRGIYGCGKITQRGVVFFEAMRWLLLVINRDDGHSNSAANHGPLIPGIKLGKKKEIKHVHLRAISENKMLFLTVKPFKRREA